MSLTDTKSRLAANTTPPTSTPPDSKGQPLTLRQAVTEFSDQITARREEYAPSLPSHIAPEKFQRAVVTAVNLNPDLLRADRLSLFNAAAKAASDGLLPDGREGALVIYNTKETDEQGKERYVKKVQWMPMIAGIIKKARQSGEISALGARIVYAEELKSRGADHATGRPLPPRFEHRVVDGIPTVNHDPILWGERGSPVLAYSFARFKDGTIDFEFMHADDIAKIRVASRSPDKGPWKAWPEEMWKKSAIRRLAKRLPISSELFDTISRDDEMTEFDRQRREAQSSIMQQARAQLGAPQAIDVAHNPFAMDIPEEFEVKDASPEPIQRAARLLANCKTSAEVKDLVGSIGEELDSDADRLVLEELGQTRLGELK